MQAGSHLGGALAATTGSTTAPHSSNCESQSGVAFWRECLTLAPLAAVAVLLAADLNFPTLQEHTLVKAGLEPVHDIVQDPEVRPELVKCRPDLHLQIVEVIMRDGLRIDQSLDVGPEPEIHIF